MRKIYLLLLPMAVLPMIGFGQWAQIGNAINGQAADDACGTSTAISADGTVVAIGSARNDNGGSSSGQVRVYKTVHGVWTQIGVDLNGESSGDQTGTDVSLSADGSVVAIGEPMNNDLGFTSGQVRVFRNVNDTWVRIGQDLYGQHMSGDAGRSVDLSSDGTVVAFGAPNEPANGRTGFIGKVRVFEEQNNNWVQKGGDIDGDGAVIKFGQSVSLSDDGNIIAIGQTGDPIRTRQDTGRVKVYQYVGNQWTQLGNTIMGVGERDEFGYKLQLSASGNILAVGSFSSHRVRIFELVNGVWTQLGNTIFGESGGFSFGFAVSLSSNGSIVAIGDRTYNSNSTWIGRAYIFENQGGNWALIDNPITGEVLNDQAGYSVALTPDGSKVAVGSIWNDNAGANAGHVRVFENSALSSNAEIALNSVTFYPNPTSGLVSFSSVNDIESITLFNLLGQEVFSKAIHSTQFDLDMSGLSNGTYIAKLNGNQKAQTVKLIKL